MTGGMIMILRTPKPDPEPKAIGLFISSGHPRMALMLALSWQWKVTFGTCFVAALGLIRFVA